MNFERLLTRLRSLITGRGAINSRLPVGDDMTAVCGYNRKFESRMVGRGEVTAVLRDCFGNIKQVEVVHNLVTSHGDDYFSGLARVGGAVSATNAMKLGTATTAAAKTGAGSFIGADYITGSNKACDSSSPKVGASSNITQFLRTYAAGEATNSTINRVSLVDNTTNGAEVDASHTWAITVFSGTIVKEASDTLTITWNITWLGA